MSRHQHQLLCFLVKCAFWFIHVFAIQSSFLVFSAPFSDRFGLRMCAVDVHTQIHRHVRVCSKSCFHLSLCHQKEAGEKVYFQDMVSTSGRSMLKVEGPTWDEHEPLLISPTACFSFWIRLRTNRTTVTMVFLSLRKLVQDFSANPAPLDFIFFSPQF